MIKRILVVGGGNGIGLAIATEFARRETCEKVYIVDRVRVPSEYDNPKFENIQFDLCNENYSLFNGFRDVDAVMITAGFGHLSLFKDIEESYITSSLYVNTAAPMRIAYHFMDKLQGDKDFYFGIMVSIAGFMSSPFFAVYGASKAALKIFIESVNVELEKSGTDNRILNVSPGSIKGTSFNSGRTDLDGLSSLASEIICHLERKDDLFIPRYEEVFKEVLARYHSDFREEGRHSYEYKLTSDRMNDKRTK